MPGWGNIGLTSARIPLTSDGFDGFGRPISFGSGMMFGDSAADSRCEDAKSEEGRSWAFL